MENQYIFINQRGGLNQMFDSNLTSCRQQIIQTSTSGHNLGKVRSNKCDLFQSIHHFSSIFYHGFFSPLSAFDTDILLSTRALTLSLSAQLLKTTTSPIRDARTRLPVAYSCENHAHRIHIFTRENRRKTG